MAKGDLKSQLGSFVRGALAQLDSVREVVVQKGKAGRIQIDVAMMKRRRKELLAELGEVIARLAANGRITEDDFPEIGPALAQLEAVEEKIAVEEDRARRVGNGEEDLGYEEEYAAAPEDQGDDVPADDEEDLDSGEKRG
jgi:hypothetical protein